MPWRSAGVQLGRADVHAAIQLHGVGVDDLGRRARARRARARGRGRAADLPVPVGPTSATRLSLPVLTVGRPRLTGARGAAGVACDGSAHDSASARSQASPARVRRTGRVGAGGRRDQEVRGRPGDDDADDVAGARAGRRPRARRSGRAGCLRRGRESRCVAVVAPALAAGDQHLDGACRRASAFSSPEMRSCRSASRS